MAKEGTCGHINKHYFNTQGKLEDLACDLPKGHTGDHHAIALRNMPEYTHDHKGIPIKVVYTETETETYWGDMAGTPAKEITAGEVSQLTAYQRDILMELMKKNPALSAEQALAAAKLEKNWR